MSNLLTGQWKQYYQMPCLPESIERALSSVAFRYYGFLCREMNVRSATELHYSNAQIGLATGIRCHKTLKKARRELERARLIKCHAVPPGVFAHIMLNHLGDPIAPPKDRKGVRRYSHAERVQEASLTKTELPVLVATPTASLLSTASIYCRTHGDVEHWQGEGRYVCQKCHPNPKSFCSPSAREIGF